GLLYSSNTFLLVAFRTICVSIISLTYEAYADISDYNFDGFVFTRCHWHLLIRFSCDGSVIAWIENLEAFVMVFSLI
ncbi:predicted protein, partial [Arabidopsis lyrata subsp. lyrata]